MSRRSAGSTQPTSDGRRLRRERSHAKMVRAMFELVGEGEMRPSARQVADRAGVGLRTVFRQFSDMENLFAEMDRMFVEEALPHFTRPAVAGPLPERAAALVRSRCRSFERFEPYLRSTRLQRARSPFLQARYASFLDQQRAQLQAWLPEIESARTDWADAMEAATSFESWDDLRFTRGLGKARTRAAVHRMVQGLVADLSSKDHKGRPRTS
jgi:AcrR family transcriptional regulator